MALARKQQLCQHTRSLLHKQHFFCRREQIKQSQCRLIAESLVQILWISKEPCLCVLATRWSTLVSCTKSQSNDSGRLCSIILPSHNIVDQWLGNIHQVQKAQGNSSRLLGNACCWGTFQCSKLLATAWPKKILSTSEQVIEAGKEREKIPRNRERRLPKLC